MSFLHSRSGACTLVRHVELLIVAQGIFDPWVPLGQSTDVFHYANGFQMEENGARGGHG